MDNDNVKTDFCEDCDKQFPEADLSVYEETEQEYPGAYVWKFEYKLCKECAKTRQFPLFRGVQENTRGF